VQGAHADDLTEFTELSSPASRMVAESHPLPPGSGRFPLSRNPVFHGALLVAAFLGTIMLVAPRGDSLTVGGGNTGSISASRSGETTLSFRRSRLSDAEWQEALGRTQADYQRIQQSAPRMQRSRKELTGSAAGGGYVDYFFGPSGVELIRMVRDGDGLRTVDEHFFRRDTLFFVFRRQRRADLPPGADQEAVENRFYFQAGELVRWRAGDRRLVDVDDPDFAREEKEILASAAALESAWRQGAATVQP
jgi:hypothetical protein